MSGARIPFFGPRRASTTRTDLTTRLDARALAAETRVRRARPRSGGRPSGYIVSFWTRAGNTLELCELSRLRGTLAHLPTPRTRRAVPTARPMPSAKKEPAPPPPAPLPPSSPPPASPPPGAPRAPPLPVAPPQPQTDLTDAFDAGVLDDGGDFTLRASLTVYSSGAELGGLAPQWTDASVRATFTPRHLQPHEPPLAPLQPHSPHDHPALNPPTVALRQGSRAPRRAGRTHDMGAARAMGRARARVHLRHRPTRLERPALPRPRLPLLARSSTRPRGRRADQRAGVQAHERRRTRVHDGRMYPCRGPRGPELLHRRRSHPTGKHPQVTRL